MTRVDLDKTLALLADAGMPSEECDPNAYMAAALQDTKDMVTELRTARPIIEAARRHECGAAYQDSVWALIVAYDQVVAS